MKRPTMDDFTTSWMQPCASPGDIQYEYFDHGAYSRALEEYADSIQPLVWAPWNKDTKYAAGFYWYKSGGYGDIIEFDGEYWRQKDIYYAAPENINDLFEDGDMLAGPIPEPQEAE